MNIKHNTYDLAASLRIESTVRRNHVYKSLWTPAMGKELCVQIVCGCSLAGWNHCWPYWKEHAGTFSRNDLAV